MKSYLILSLMIFTFKATLVRAEAAGGVSARCEHFNRGIRVENENQRDILEASKAGDIYLMTTDAKNGVVSLIARITSSDAFIASILAGLPQDGEICFRASEISREPYNYERLYHGKIIQATDFRTELNILDLTDFAI